MDYRMLKEYHTYYKCIPYIDNLDIIESLQIVILIHVFWFNMYTFLLVVCTGETPKLQIMHVFSFCRDSFPEYLYQFKFLQPCRRISIVLPFLTNTLLFGKPIDDFNLQLSDVFIHLSQYILYIYFRFEYPFQCSACSFCLISMRFLPFSF